MNKTNIAYTLLAMAGAILAAAVTANIIVVAITDRFVPEQAILDSLCAKHSTVCKRISAEVDKDVDGRKGIAIHVTSKVVRNAAGEDWKNVHGSMLDDIRRFADEYPESSMPILGDYLLHMHVVEE